MANQMIALGIKPAPLPDLGAATARMSNVMANMAVAKEKQAGIQRANAFRQLVSSPQFDPSNPEHIKAAQALDPAGTEKIISGYDSRQKAQLERIGLLTQQFRDTLVNIDPADKESYTQFRADVVAAVPGWGKFLPTPEQWNADTRLRTLMKAQNVIDKAVPTPTASAQQDASGNFYGVTVGGLNPPTATPVQEMTMGGQGGPLEAAPMMPGAKSPRLSADLASPLLNVRDEASYQQALQMIGTVNPDAANQLRQIMPQFDPARMEGIREAAFAEFEKVPQPSQGLVAGERGGVGGPYVSTGRQFRGRVPAPPVGPQPRETAEEVYAKEQARLRAQNEAAQNAPPKKLTPAQEQRLRANIAEDKKAVDDTIVQMLDSKEGILGAIDGVRKLSKSQKEWLVGKTNYIPSFTDAGQTADTRWENLTGKATKMGLAMARLGGSIGPMAVQEWSIVRNMIASLDPVKMSPQALEEQLDIIEATARGIAQRVKSAYENQYAEEFARYPGRFEIKNTPTSSSGRGRAGKNGGVDLNNPLLKGR